MIFFLFNFPLRENFFSTSPAPPPPPICFLMVRPLSIVFNSVDNVVPGGGGAGKGEKNTPYNGLRLNPAYTNIKGSVRVNWVEFTENVRTFVPQGQEKLSVKSRGVRKA